MDIEKINKYSLAEVALLAIFFVGLFISGQIVKWRMRVELSEPFELSGSGLSVRLPSNPGWEHTPDWQYEESGNNMVLIGQYRNQTGGRAEVRWGHSIATPDGSGQELLELRAQQIGATIHGIKTIGNDNSMIYATIVVGAEMKQAFILGLMQLGHNRSVELQVKSYRINDFYNQQLFTSLVESIQYQTVDELREGRSFLDDFLTNGLESFQDEAYLIKDQIGRILGYYSTRHSLFKDGQKTLRRSHIRQKEKQSFQLNSSLWFNPIDTDYRWETEIGLPGGKSVQHYQIEREKGGDITIDRSLEETRTITGVQFFLPEPLLAEIAIAFIESSYEKVVIDVVSAQGQMVPVRLSRVSPEQSVAKAKNVFSVVRLDYLHRADSFEDFLFDADLKIIGKFEQSSARRIRIWDSVSIQDLEERFDIDLSEMMDQVALDTAVPNDINKTF